jgi:predicted ABC-class ATPase
MRQRFGVKGSGGPRAREDLLRTLSRIDGRGYKAYEDIRGSYDFGDFVLALEHIQGDPFASPSRARVFVEQSEAAFPSSLFSTPARRLGLEDFVGRAFSVAARRETRGHAGMGTSGLVAIDAGGQEVLRRTAISISAERLEARFFVGLPAFGRSIDGKGAARMLTREVPSIVRASLFFRALAADAAKRHVDVVEDQEALRAALRRKGLVAFVANGSILPRASGVDERPLSAQPGAKVIPFVSPPSLEVVLEAPNRGELRGMGIAEGVTLVAGGGFHGKSTLLRALERGVYDHIPGDGREYVVPVPEAVKIRAEDGRNIEKVDISPFIDHLPLGKDTRRFSTENASGSTSQAANIVEAVEVGARLLLIDEDTSATNFMIRDGRMQALIRKEHEPITPFVDRVRQLYEQHGVSTILVMGGSGDYLEVADRVVAMVDYRPEDVTERARAVVSELPNPRRAEGGPGYGPLRARLPSPESFSARKGKREVKISAKGVRMLLFGTTAIDLSCLEQLVDVSQTRAIGELIHLFAENWLPRSGGLREGLERMLAEVAEKGFDAFTPYPRADLALPRIFEVAGAINRMRTLVVRGCDTDRVPG